MVNGFFSKPVSIIRERAKLPPPDPGQPGPFSLGAPGTLTAALEQAGFRDVEERVVAAPVVLPTAAECLRFERVRRQQQHVAAQVGDRDDRAVGLVPGVPGRAPEVVCLVDVKASAQPVYAKTTKGNECFYVRAGNTTRMLGGPALVSYIREHWS